MLVKYSTVYRYLRGRNERHQSVHPRAWCMMARVYGKSMRVHHIRIFERFAIHSKRKCIFVILDRMKGKVTGFFFNNFNDDEGAKNSHISDEINILNEIKWNEIIEVCRKNILRKLPSPTSKKRAS